MVVERQKQVIWMAYAEIKARKSAKCQYNHQSAAKIIIEKGGDKVQRLSHRV